MSAGPLIVLPPTIGLIAATRDFTRRKFKLRSTAFPEMGDDEFSAFCDFAVPCLFRDYIPGIRAPEQRKLINEWAGRRPKLEEPPKLILPR